MDEEANLSRLHASAVFAKPKHFIKEQSIPLVSKGAHQ
jgi:hypothetical protein